MYSEGKKLLEQERNAPKLSALEKAKLNFQLYVKELERTKSLAEDPAWINTVTESIQKALLDYENSKKELLLQIKDAEQKVELRGSIGEFLQKANALDDTFVDIKVLLSQIFRVVTAHYDRIQQTCENIDRELAK
jgi:hypothetical protein